MYLEYKPYIKWIACSLAYIKSKKIQENVKEKGYQLQLLDLNKILENVIVINKNYYLHETHSLTLELDLSLVQH